MYIPSPQSLLTAGMALTSSLTTLSTISKGKVLDFAVEKCIDADGNQRCSKPFLVMKDTCYTINWDTSGTFSHTTAEVRDVKSSEIVHYQDTNGDWTPKKGELVYVDFMPKVPKTGNSTVKYKITTCSDSDSDDM